MSILTFIDLLGLPSFRDRAPTLGSEDIARAQDANDVSALPGDTDPRIVFPDLILDRLSQPTRVARGCEGVRNFYLSLLGDDVPAALLPAIGRLRMCERVGQ
jgi:hypothetical protein